MKRLFLLLCFCVGTYAARSQTKIKLWVNAFIPTNATTNPIKVSVGAHREKSAILSPVTKQAFLTDQRDFSDDPNAKSRISVLIDLDLDQMYDYTPESFQKAVKKRCDPTISVNIDDGSETCNQSSSTSGITVDGYSVQRLGQENIINFTINASAKNPCVLVSNLPTPSLGVPAIDFKIPVFIKQHVTTNKITLGTIEGKVEPFPAFEMYAQYRTSSVKSIFKKSPAADASPTILYGSPTVDVTGIIQF